MVHQIRNSLKYVASKEQKVFMKDLKLVYQTYTKDQAEIALLELEEKWGKKYPVVIRSWNNNWDRLSTSFEYSQPIRRLIYNTITIEGFHIRVRKVTKSKGAFTSEMVIMKLVYLVTKRIEKKWTSLLQNSSLTVQQLAIRFEGRLELDLNPDI